MITEALRAEHKDLLPYVEELRTAADSIGSADVEELLRTIDEVERFLSRGLIPHAIAEDRALYPEVQRLMGAKSATATMSRDHEEVVALTRELSAAREQMSSGTIGEAGERQLRRLLYGLYALVQIHFKKEEEIYLPLLDAGLSREEGEALFASMEAAAAEAKRG